MPRTSRFLPVLLLLVMGATSGCLYSREIAQTRRDIERQYPDLHLKRAFVLSAGPGTIGFARWITGFVRDDEDVRFASNVLENVRRVKVGVYEIQSPVGNLDAYDLPSLRRYDRDGWETAARVREDEEVVWVMYREHRARVEHMFIGVLDGESLVLVRLDGDLEAILQRVLEENGSFWND